MYNTYSNYQRYPQYNYTINHQPQKKKDMKIHFIIFGIMLLLFIFYAGTSIAMNRNNDSKVTNHIALIRQHERSATKQHLDNYLRIDENIMSRPKLINAAFDHLSYNAPKNQYTLTLSPELLQINNMFIQAAKSQRKISKSQKDVGIQLVLMLAAIKVQRHSISKETHGRTKGIIVKPYLSHNTNLIINKEVHNKDIATKIYSMDKYKNKRLNELMY